MNYPVYTGEDLGVNYQSYKSIFKIWAPSASNVILVLYEDSNDLNGSEIPMNKSVKGTWTIEVFGDLDGYFYIYKVLINGNINEVVDPYARGLSINGKKGIVIDLLKTNPPGFEQDIRPDFKGIVNSIIYEIHIRDFTIDVYSGIKNRGKYVGMTEPYTTTKNGTKTGLAHLKELGITHVQIMPVMDFATVDEIRQDSYNWGYDPHHYFCPDGWYSCNPSDGYARIKEFKSLVHTFHKNGIRVVMDVVFNHTYSTIDSIFEKLVPGYFYRKDINGRFCNGSGCGNEVASEKPMVRKLILDSIKYWVKEYHIDGFRFDLMALHDIDTMHEIKKAVASIDDSIVIYGEPWTGGFSSLPSDKMMLKGAQKNTGIAVFNDDFRNAIKGDPDGREKGFISKAIFKGLDIMKGVVGEIYYSNEINGFTETPSETINYVSCHDNLTLWDKLKLCCTEYEQRQLIKMHLLAGSIILTSQGVPFIHSGMEFLRTKRGVHNSYSSGDDINKIDWSLKEQNSNVFCYFKKLIKLRKEHPAFCMNSPEQIRNNLRFLNSPSDTIVFEMVNNANNDTWKNIVVIYNPHATEQTIVLPQYGIWKIAVDSSIAGVISDSSNLGQIESDKVFVPDICCLVLYKND